MENSDSETPNGRKPPSAESLLGVKIRLAERHVAVFRIIYAFGITTQIMAMASNRTTDMSFVLSTALLLALIILFATIGSQGVDLKADCIQLSGLPTPKMPVGRY